MTRWRHSVYLWRQNRENLKFTDNSYTWKSAGLAGLQMFNTRDTTIHNTCRERHLRHCTQGITCKELIIWWHGGPHRFFCFSVHRFLRFKRHCSTSPKVICLKILTPSHVRVRIWRSGESTNVARLIPSSIDAELFLYSAPRGFSLDTPVSLFHQKPKDLFDLLDSVWFVAIMPS